MSKLLEITHRLRMPFRLIPILWFHMTLNSLVPGRYECDSKYVISILFYRLVSSDLLMIMPSDECLTDDQSTLVQVMAWCLQATNHYLSQCWPRSLPPYGVTRPQWVHLIGRCQSKWQKKSCKSFIISSVNNAGLPLRVSSAFIGSKCSYQLWLTLLTFAPCGHCEN